MSSDPRVQQIEKEIEKERNEINRLQSSLFTPSQHKADETDEMIGEQLLHAFLEDEPFDRFAFGRAPVKCAFIDAALKTGDMEIIEACFGFVEQGMTSKAFKNMIKDTPQYIKIYNKLHKNNKSMYRKEKFTPDNIPFLKELSQNEENPLVKQVIDDHIQRLSGKKPDYGIEDVDNKWSQFKNATKSAQQFIRADQLISKTGLFSTRWKTAIDPYQAARMALYWRAPQQYVDSFVKEIKDPKEKAFFPQH